MLPSFTEFFSDERETFHGLWVKFNLLSGGSLTRSAAADFDWA
jgi:hypothetical protein